MASSERDWRLRVRAVHPLGPGMTRVVFGFPEGGPPPAARHPAGHCMLFFPDGAGRFRGRSFTYRRWRSDGGLEVDFARHAGDGPAARWIAGAAAGDLLPIRLGGPPKLAAHDWRGRTILVADPAGLPVVAALAEMAPASARIEIVLSLPKSVDAAAFPDAAGIPVTVLRHAPTNATPVLEVLSGLKPGATDTVFTACEASTMRAVRRHAADCLGVPGGRLTTSGYWKSGADREAVEVLKRQPAWFGESPAPEPGVRGADGIGVAPGLAGVPSTLVTG